LTFERDDIFNRKPFVESITKLISEWGEDIFVRNDSLSISVDSPWGTGKSSLLGMWANYLAESPKYSRYKTVYYNAWQNNYFDDPMRPLLFELQGGENGPRVDDFRKKSVELAKAIAMGDNDVARIMTHRDGDASSYLEGFRKINQACEGFSKSLEKLVPANGKFIVFIDELDRCRPDFAVSTLEIICHYMSVPGMVFIFTIDLAQLIHLVKTVYGFDTDAWGYLRRFFNISFKMPMPDLGRYVDNLLYNSIMDSEGLKEAKFSKHMVELYKFFGLPIRDVEKITTNFIIFYSMNKINKDPLKPGLFKRLVIYLYFMIIKYKYPDVYNGVMGREGYHIEGDLVEGKYVLQRKYCGLGDVKDLLRLMQGNRMWDEDAGPGYVAEHLILDIVPDAKSMGHHLNDSIALFAEDA
jgi:hypothetical protein